MRRMALALSFAIAFASPAFATDLPRERQRFVAQHTPVHNWTGLYVDAVGGGAFGTEVVYTAGTFRDAERFGNGWLAGATVGARVQRWGNFVVGVDVTALATGLKTRRTTNFVSYDEWGGIYKDSYTNTGRLPWLVMGNVQLGWSLDRFLPYVTGGFAGAQLASTSDYRFDYSSPWIGTATGGFTTKSARYALGWNAGAGLNWAVTQNVVVGVHYRYYDLGLQHNQFGSFREDTRINGHLAMGTIGFRF